MKLYHGTSALYLSSILANGVKPRGRKPGNWEGTVRSNGKAVYLTNAYPIHFASVASKDSADLLVLEIDTDQLDLSLMAPDEDCLEQCTRKDEAFAHVPGTEPFDMKRRTMWFRKRALSEFGYLWEKSLELLGTCCYYAHVPPYAITAYVKVPAGHRLLFASDPTITPMNYLIMGAYYRQLTRAMFGYELQERDKLMDSHLQTLTDTNLTKGILLVQQQDVAA